MHISCPKCHFKRSVNSKQIPASATMATCPKCEGKFRFRDLETGDFIDEICSDLDDANLNKPEHSTEPSSSKGNSPKGDFAENGTSLRSNTPTDGADYSENSDKNGKVHGENPSHDTNSATQNQAEEKTQGVTQEKNVQDIDNDEDSQVQESISGKDEKGQEKSQNQEKKSVDEDLSSYQDAANNEDPKPLREEEIIKKYDNEDRDNPLRNPQENSYSQMKTGKNEKYQMVTDDVPWEHPERYGIVGSLFQTIARVMFRAPEFFSTIHSQSSTLRPATFYALLGLFQTLCLQIWLSTIGSIEGIVNNPVMAEQISQFSTPMTIIMSPFVSVFQLMLFSAFLYLAIRITNPDQADYNLILRIVAYAYAPLILTVVPYFGLPVGFIWFVVNIFIGIKYALRLTWQRTILALSPIFLLWLFIIVSSVSRYLG